jgi:hypothetical protein
MWVVLVLAEKEAAAWQKMSVEAIRRLRRVVVLMMDVKSHRGGDYGLKLSRAQRKKTGRSRNPSRGTLGVVACTHVMVA